MMSAGSPLGFRTPIDLAPLADGARGGRDRTEMIEAIVDSIRVNLVTQNRVLFLREMQGMTPQRPLPYDLMMSMLGELDARVARVVVNDLSHDIYYARIVLERSGEFFEIDSRPSDAIAVAVRARCPIFVDDSVMDRAGVSVTDDEADEDEADSSTPREPMPAGEEENLTIFRDFINTLDIDDLDTRSN